MMALTERAEEFIANEAKDEAKDRYDRDLERVDAQPIRV